MSSRGFGKCNRKQGIGFIVAAWYNQNLLINASRSLLYWTSRFLCWNILRGPEAQPTAVPGSDEWQGVRRDDLIFMTCQSLARIRLDFCHAMERLDWQAEQFSRSWFLQIEPQPERFLTNFEIEGKTFSPQKFSSLQIRNHFFGFGFFDLRKIKNKNLGGGCVSVDWAVASDTRDPWSESRHWQSFIYPLYI